MVHLDRMSLLDALTAGCASFDTLQYSQSRGQAKMIFVGSDFGGEESRYEAGQALYLEIEKTHKSRSILHLACGLRETPRLREVQLQCQGRLLGQAHFRKWTLWLRAAHMRHDAGCVSILFLQITARQQQHTAQQLLTSRRLSSEAAATVSRPHPLSYQLPSVLLLFTFFIPPPPPSSSANRDIEPDRHICAHIDIMAPILNFHAGSLPSFALRLKSDDSLER